MNIAVLIESENQNHKKASLECLSFCQKLKPEKIVSIVIGNYINKELLNLYGSDQIAHFKEDTDFIESKIEALKTVYEKESLDIIVFGGSYDSKALAPYLAAQLNIPYLNGISDVVVNDDIQFKKSCFSNKAYVLTKLAENKGVIQIIPNSIELSEKQKDSAIQEYLINNVANKISTIETQINKGKIPLTEAENVVSAGRGLKGPENWGMIEELADLLGAATACSKPVSDMEWRPHSEHVGQTGITIKPNLYIAIGISGAIQHLAGVSSSKVICVINKDPEAPFFKAADYGIVGDAFEIVPKLIAKLKAS